MLAATHCYVCTLLCPTSSNQWRGCGGSLLLHAGCYFLIGSLLLGGLDEAVAWELVGWLSEVGVFPRPELVEWTEPLVLITTEDTHTHYIYIYIYINTHFIHLCLLHNPSFWPPNFLSALLTFRLPSWLSVWVVA